MIIIITYRDREDNQTYVDHGINLKDDSVVTLPQVPVSALAEAKFDLDVGEYVLYDKA
jgi:hypothetical protein